MPRSLRCHAAVLALAFVAGASSRLTAQERIDSAMNAAIRVEGFQRSRVIQTARILSDAFGPRLAGSPGYHAAARWARDQLRSFGAATAVLEPWGRRGPGWELRRFSVEVTAPAYLRVTAMPKAWSLPLARPVTGTPLVVDIAGPADFDRWRGRLRGRIVLLGRIPEAADTLARFAAGARRFTEAQLDSMTRLTDPGEPRDYWADADGFRDVIAAHDRIRQFLREQGVAATLEASDNELTIRAAEYDTYGSSRRNNLPAFVIDRSHYRRILVQLHRGARVSMTASLEARTFASDTTGYNIVAEIPGTDPALRGEVVMVGGHFDSWHTGSGATDNAAGSAVAMEVLRILKATGARPRRTIRVALWDGEEEEDYWGSLGYVKRHFGDPVTMRLTPEHETLAGYFNVDNGTGRVRGLYLQGHEAVRPIFAQLLEPFRDLGATTLTIAKHGSTDHMTFNAVGLPGFEVIQDPIDYEPRTHHTGLDASGFLLEKDLQQASVVVASLVYHVAMRDEKLPRPAMPPPKAATAGRAPGTWTIIGHRLPGISAMGDAEARRFHGRQVILGARRSVSGADICATPSYTARRARTDSLLAEDYRVAPAALGLERVPDVTVIEVTCGGRAWMTLGGSLLLLSERKALATWDGVFFELERKAPTRRAP